MNTPADNALRILVVDDEAPARQRLQDLLDDIAADLPLSLVASVGSGVEAARFAAHTPVDVVLSDIDMPGMNGVELARHLRQMASPPVVVFVTAYDRYALQAFEVAAVDYLLKPVAAERLQQALERARQQKNAPAGEIHDIADSQRFLRVTAREQVFFVAIEDVLFFRAEQKYVAAVTAEQTYWLDESLAQIEQTYGQRLLRVHRACLVARSAVERVQRSDSGDGYEIVIAGQDERLPVSRRQWPALRRMLGL